MSCEALEREFKLGFAFGYLRGYMIGYKKRYMTGIQKDLRIYKNLTDHCSHQMLWELNKQLAAMNHSLLEEAVNTFYISQEKQRKLRS